MGTGVSGFDLKKATADLREASGLNECETIRKEGAPIPLKPLKKWDNDQDVVLAGDAAGVVAPSSGEGFTMPCVQAVRRHMPLPRRCAQITPTFTLSAQTLCQTTRHRIPRTRGNAKRILQNRLSP